MVPSALDTTASSGLTCVRWCGEVERWSVFFFLSFFARVAGRALFFPFPSPHSYLVERLKHDTRHLVSGCADTDVAARGRGGGPGGGAGVCGRENGAHEINQKQQKKNR